MTIMFDARVGVAFGVCSDARDGDFILSDGLSLTAGHAAGCTCCTSRTPASEALGRLFVQRARGEVEFFRRVLVVSDEAGEGAVRAALEADPVVSARFRLA